MKLKLTLAIVSVFLISFSATLVSGSGCRWSNAASSKIKRARCRSDDGLVYASIRAGKFNFTSVNDQDVCGCHYDWIFELRSISAGSYVSVFGEGIRTYPLDEFTTHDGAGRLRCDESIEVRLDAYNASTNANGTVDPSTAVSVCTMFSTGKIKCNDVCP